MRAQQGNATLEPGGLPRLRTGSPAGPVVAVIGLAPVERPDEALAADPGLPKSPAAAVAPSFGKGQGGSVRAL